MDHHEEQVFFDWPGLLKNDHKRPGVLIIEQERTLFDSEVLLRRIWLFVRELESEKIILLVVQQLP